MSERPQGILLFKVALVSDTHVNEREDVSASSYPANGQANGRARHVFPRSIRTNLPSSSISEI